ncbi:cytochrome P450 [Pyronema omphalodes]|nr:cytochrome P450 [Pyronema omphalodes]
MSNLVEFALSALSLLIILIVRRYRTPQAKAPPVFPYQIPWIGLASTFSYGAFKHLLQAHKIFGPLQPVTFVVAGRRIHVFTHPSDITAVYRNKLDLSFEKTVETFFLGCDYPSDPESISRLRTLLDSQHDMFVTHMSPTKTADIVRSMLPTMQSQIATLTKCTEELDLFEWSYSAIATSVLTAMWGPRLLAENPGFISTLRKLDDDMLKLSAGLPRWMRRNETAHLEAVIEMFRKYYTIPQTEGPSVTKDRAMECFELGCTLDEIAAQNTFLVFGFTTNMPRHAAWATYWISQDQNLLEKVRKEIEPAFKGGEPNMDYLMTECPIFKAAWNESIRVSGSAQSSRSVLRDTKIGEYEVKEGSIVLCVSRSAQTLEDIWGHNPEEFNADRFLNNPALERSPYFRPFGGGTSLCGGRHMASRLGLTFTAILLRKFDITAERTEVSIESPLLAGTFRPKGPMRTRIKERSIAA